MRARDNPFRTERILQVRYRLSEAGWNELLSRFEAARYRGALVGPRGSGKTTLLEDLEHRLRARGFGTRLLRLNEEEPALDLRFLARLCQALTARDILLLDGAEQMNWFAWRSFLWRTRSAAGLLITTHQHGRLPTVWECRTSCELLVGIAADLLGTRSMGLRRQAEALFTRHRGNLRDALREWYDLFAAAPG